MAASAGSTPAPVMDQSVSPGAAEVVEVDGLMGAVEAADADVDDAGAERGAVVARAPRCAGRARRGSPSRARRGRPCCVLAGHVAPPYSNMSTDERVSSEMWVWLRFRLAFPHSCQLSYAVERADATLEAGPAATRSMRRKAHAVDRYLTRQGLPTGGHGRRARHGGDRPSWPARAGARTRRPSTSPSWATRRCRTSPT